MDAMTGTRILDEVQEWVHGQDRDWFNRPDGVRGGATGYGNTPVSIPFNDIVECWGICRFVFEWSGEIENVLLVPCMDEAQFNAQQRLRGLLQWALMPDGCRGGIL